MTGHVAVDRGSPIMSPVNATSHDLPTPVLISRRQKMFSDMARVVRGHSSQCYLGMREILKRDVAVTELLDGLSCPGSRERYTRHLLHEGAGFSVLAVVWMPGQMSPVHSHRSWCALGVHRGELVETWFSPGAPEQALQVTGCRHLRRGMASGSPASDTDCHRVANLGVEAAISIHVYGMAFDRLGRDLNRIWAD